MIHLGSFFGRISTTFEIILYLCRDEKHLCMSRLLSITGM